MKKIILSLVTFFCFSIIVEAECGYKEIKELNTLASYVESSYQFNESTGNFDLTIINLGDKIYIRSEDKYFYPTSGEVKISVPAGTDFSGILLGTSNSACINETLRMIKVNLPYKNPFYMNSKCVGHEELDVCNHKFLNYQLSEYTFNKLLEKGKNEDLKDNEEESNNPDIIIEEDKSFWESVVDFLKNSYVPILLVIASTCLPIAIYSVIYRKIKHGL